MLISHAYRFIFIKTVKTAGTSVEAFLEPFCTAPGHRVQHHTPTLITPYGIVARRGPERPEPDHGFTSHMDAAEIRHRFAAFDHYRRFTIVRDPYDRAVSWFHFQAERFNHGHGLSLDEARALLASGRHQQLRKAFLQFVRELGVPREQDRLCIDNRLAVHRWLRFEHLVADLDALMRDWHLPIPASGVADSLPRFKVIRQGSEDKPPVEAYLSADSVELINALCSWSFATFDYPLRNPQAFPAADSARGD